VHLLSALLGRPTEVYKYKLCVRACHDAKLSNVAPKRKLWADVSPRFPGHRAGAPSMW